MLVPMFSIGRGLLGKPGIERHRLHLTGETEGAISVLNSIVQRLDRLGIPIGSNVRPLSLLIFGSCEEISGQDSNLGSIPCLELSHDMAKMNLYRVLAHIEFVGDLFVGLSMTNFLDHLHLPLRQQKAGL
jgi:hypothetical protein